MRCKQCNCWIYQGFEVLFNGNYYHSECAVEAAKQAKKAKRKAKFTLIRGGKYVQMEDLRRRV